MLNISLKTSFIIFMHAVFYWFIIQIFCCSPTLWFEKSTKDKTFLEVFESRHCVMFKGHNNIIFYSLPYGCWELHGKRTFTNTLSWLFQGTRSVGEHQSLYQISHTDFIKIKEPTSLEAFTYIFLFHL